jgi:hypothetical protein
VCPMSPATGGGFDNSEYQRLRSDLLGVQRLRPMLPAFLRPCRDTGAFWRFIKPKFTPARNGGDTFAVNLSRR